MKNHLHSIARGAVFVAALFGLALNVSAEIVVGQSAPLSGSNADFGNDIRAGAMAYFRKVNEAGGVAGQKIKLVTLDDKNDAKLAGENTKKLLSDDSVVALFGYASSTLSMPAMPFVTEKHVPFFAPFTGADVIRKQSEYVFTIRVSYTEEIDKLVGFWGGLGATRITVLHYDDAVGKQNYDSVAAALKKYGKVPTSVAIKRNAELEDAAVDKIIEADPQMVVVTTLAAPAAKLVTSLKARNKPFQVTSLSFVGVSQLAKLLGPDAAGITVALTVPAPRNLQVPIVKECAEAWTAAGNVGPISVTALEACVAAKILVDGMKRAGKDITRDNLQKSLASLGKVDVGGLEVAFKPGFHHGGKFVDIAVIRSNGELRN
ncbi:MAG TPA: ABC transporter substrate-binding protein [Usitatibacteraceae bacterium]